MIRSYQFQLSTPQSFTAAYPLYAAMLERAPKEFAARLHESAVTPVSQYVCGDTWRVSLFGPEAIDTLAPVLETMEEVFLRREQRHVGLELRSSGGIETVDELLELPPRSRSTLELVTPTAFKSGGVYQLLPTQRLVMQSLILKWNGCFGDICPIEDEGGGLEALAEGLCYRSVQLNSQLYSMKHTQIPGVVGSVAFDCRQEGFLRQLTNALLTFGTYSGLGIKTTLGMGGLQITTKRGIPCSEY